MRLGLPTMLLALSASPLLAQASSPPITRDQAMALSPDEIAQLVLGQVGSQVRTMTRPNFAPDSDMRMVSALQDLTFATAPRATDTVGLCVADRIDVNFEHDGANESETAIRPRRIRAAQVYKVVGEIEPHAEVSEERQAEEGRRCAGAGPVVQADYSDNGRAHFFHFQGDNSPVTALLVLQRAVGEGRTGVDRDIRCVAECVPRLSALDLTKLNYVSIGPMGVGGDRNLRRVAASFFIESHGHCSRHRTVEIEVEIEEVWGGARNPIRRLGRLDMSDTDICEN